MKNDVPVWCSHLSFIIHNSVLINLSAFVVDKAKRKRINTRGTNGEARVGLAKHRPFYRMHFARF